VENVSLMVHSYVLLRRVFATVDSRTAFGLGASRLVGFRRHAANLQFSGVTRRNNQGVFRLTLWVIRRKCPGLADRAAKAFGWCPPSNASISMNSQSLQPNCKRE
jgi:hypothetical protein